MAQNWNAYPLEHSPKNNSKNIVKKLTKWNTKEEQREKYTRHMENKYKMVNMKPTRAKLQYI